VIADGDDRVEVVEGHGLVRGGNMHFLHSALGRELVVCQRSAEVA